MRLSVLPGQGQPRRMTPLDMVGDDSTGDDVAVWHLRFEVNEDVIKPLRDQILMLGLHVPAPIGAVRTCLDLKVGDDIR